MARKNRDKAPTAAKIKRTERTNSPRGSFRSRLDGSVQIVGTIGTAPRPRLTPATGIRNPEKRSMLLVWEKPPVPIPG